MRLEPFRNGVSLSGARIEKLESGIVSLKDMREFERMSLWERIKEYFNGGEMAKTLHSIAVCSRAARSDESMSRSEIADVEKASEYILEHIKPDCRKFCNPQIGAHGVTVELQGVGIKLLLDGGCFGQGGGALTRAEVVSLLREKVGDQSFVSELAGFPGMFTSFQSMVNIQSLLDKANERSGRVVDFEEGEPVNKGGAAVKLDGAERTAMVDVYLKIAQHAGDHSAAAEACERAALCMSEECFSEERVEAWKAASDEWKCAAEECRVRGSVVDEAKALERAALASMRIAKDGNAKGADVNAAHVKAAHAWERVAFSCEERGNRLDAAAAMGSAGGNYERAGRREDSKNSYLQIADILKADGEGLLNESFRTGSKKMESFESAGDRFKSAGDLQWSAGEEGAAVELRLRAAEMYQFAGTRFKEADVYLEMSQISRAKGDFAKAADFEMACGRARGGEAKDGHGRVIPGSHKPDREGDAYGRAAADYFRAGMHASGCAALVKAGKAYEIAGRYAEAQLAYETAAEEFAKEVDVHGSADKARMAAEACRKKEKEVDERVSSARANGAGRSAMMDAAMFGMRL